jgi:pyridoxamine 5'-phosphate oxidase family protein
MFSDAEKHFLKTQHLARIATVSMDGQPDVAPVGFQFDGTKLFIGGRAPEKTLKYQNVASGQTRVAIVIDDLQSVTPWMPRGIKIHGSARIVENGVLQITPTIHWHWGIVGSSFEIQIVTWGSSG